MTILHHLINVYFWLQQQWIKVIPYEITTDSQSLTYLSMNIIICSTSSKFVTMSWISVTKGTIFNHAYLFSCKNYNSQTPVVYNNNGTWLIANITLLFVGNSQIVIATLTIGIPVVIIFTIAMCLGAIVVYEVVFKRKKK